MGLYDAVDRTSAINWHQKSVIYNVDHSYHALRDILVGSRTTKKLSFGINSFLFNSVGFDMAGYAISKVLDFDNTGTQSGDSGEYVSKTLKTSHSGIGGDILTFTSVSVPVIESLLADDSCAVSMFNQLEAQVQKMELCLSESVSADRFIKEGARKYGVRI